MGLLPQRNLFYRLIRLPKVGLVSLGALVSNQAAAQAIKQAYNKGVKEEITGLRDIIWGPEAAIVIAIIFVAVGVAAFASTRVPKSMIAWAFLFVVLFYASPLIIEGVQKAFA